MIKIIMGNGNEYITDDDYNDFDVNVVTEKVIYIQAIEMIDDKPYFSDGYPVFREFHIALNTNQISEYSFY